MPDINIPIEWFSTCIRKIGGTNSDEVCKNIWLKMEELKRSDIIKNRRIFKQCDGKICYAQKLDLKEIIPMSKRIIKQSRKCVSKFPSMVDHANACEVGILPTLEQNVTLHTHTDKEINYPSDRDIQTTNELGKEFLCIANSGNGQLICYHEKDGFQHPVFQRKIL